MSFAFNGANQYLRIASAPATGAPMTIAAHVRPTSMTGTRTVGAVGQAPQPGRHRNQIVMLSTGAIRATAGGSTNAFSDSTSTASLNTWCHTAGVFSSLSSRTSYLNGTASSENTTTISQLSLTEVVIAAQQGNVANTYENLWIGNIAEFGIWNVALTAAEISSLSNGMACNLIRPQSLVFYAPLVRDLIDARSGLTITNVNSATVANHPRIYY